MEEALKISVIVPVFNVEKYLHRCIDSILCQVYQDFELILIDDGSSDSSAKICDDYSEADQRVKVIHQKNQGVSVARNNGLKLAKGKWIAFVDADDYIDKDYLLSLVQICRDDSFIVLRGVKFAKLPQQTIGYTGISKDVYDKVSSTKDAYIALLSKYLPFVSPWAKLFNLQIIRSNGILFNENFHNGEDRIFVAQYLLADEIRHIKIVDSDGYFYVFHSNSATSHLAVSAHEWAEVNLLWNALFEKMNKKFDVADRVFIQKCKSFIKTMVIDSVILLFQTHEANKYRLFCHIQKEIETKFHEIRCNEGYSWCEYLLENFHPILSFYLIGIRVRISLLCN